MKKRILFVTQTPEYGGAEKHLLDLIARLDPSAVDCTILCCLDDVFSSRLDGRSPVRVITRGRLNSFWAYWLTFLKCRPQIIVLIKGIFDHYFFSGHVAARACGARRFFVIEHLIADPAPRSVGGAGLWSFARRLCGWQARRLARIWLQARLSDATICVSDAVRTRLVREYGYPEGKTVTIRNGVDFKRFHSRGEFDGDVLRTTLRIDPQQRVILCVARLSPVKRIDVLLDALATLNNCQVAWKCLIVGSGPLETELRSRSDALGLSGSVVFVGHVRDVRPYLNIADLFVLPSEKEGLPLALLEAMASGIACIATAVGGNGEVVLHGQTGLLVQPGAAEELGDAMRSLLTNDAARQDMASKGKSRICDCFDSANSMGAIARLVLHDS